jgi:hypothetical protein
LTSCRQHRGEPSEAKFPNRPPVVGLLPGSRKGEAMGMYSAMLQVADRIKAQFPNVRFVTPTVAATHAIVTEKAAGRTDITIAQDAFDTLVPQCDLCVVASGTATLHVAGFGVPMVVVYRGGNRLVYHGLARWLIITKKFSLVNLLAERDEWVAPEFIPWFCDPDPVANSAIDFLKHPEKLKATARTIEKADSRPGSPRRVDERREDRGRDDGKEWLTTKARSGLCLTRIALLFNVFTDLGLFNDLRTTNGASCLRVFVVHSPPQASPRPSRSRPIWRRPWAAAKCSRYTVRWVRAKPSL